MPTVQHRCSLTAYFPADVYQNVGITTVLPQLMQILNADKVLAVQFLRVGRVRLTFDDPVTRDEVLANGLVFDGAPLRLTSTDDRFRIAFLRDLPVEADDEAVSAFCSAYGDVLSVEHCYFEDFLSVRNGNRRVKILLTEEIPCFVRVESYDCCVWYPRQPPQCFICRERGHCASACPLSGLCRRCHQPGHLARECTWAWGPALSTDASVPLQVL